jgi:cytochrome P450
MFKRLRAECPVHWTERITEYPGEAGYWSVTRADDVHAVSRYWETYSSELGGSPPTRMVMITDIDPPLVVGSPDPTAPSLTGGRNQPRGP